MNWILNKYIFKEILSVLVVSLFVLVVIIFATKILTISEWMLNFGVSPLQILSLLFYLFPDIILFAMPAANLIAVMLSFMRFSSDNEIIALQSSGISIYQAMTPVFALSLAACLITLFMGLFAAPWGSRSFKELTLKIIEEKVDVGIKERVFSEPFEDVIFYINSISPRGKILRDVFVVDKRQDRTMTNTIVAREGMIVVHHKTHALTLRLSDGIIFVTERDLKSVRTITFKTYDLHIDLKKMVSGISKREKDSKELFLSELFHRKKMVGQKGEELNEIIMEIMGKFAIPIGVFLMGMIGVPLGVQVRRGGRPFGIFLGAGVFIVYYAILAGMRSLGETGALSPAFGPWVPDLFLLFVFIWFLNMAAKDSGFRLGERLAILLRKGKKQKAA